jgi:hypothetical protein
VLLTASVHPRRFVDRYVGRPTPTCQNGSDLEAAKRRRVERGVGLHRAKPLPYDNTATVFAGPQSCLTDVTRSVRNRFLVSVRCLRNFGEMVEN